MKELVVNASGCMGDAISVALMLVYSLEMALDGCLGQSLVGRLMRKWLITALIASSVGVVLVTMVAAVWAYVEIGGFSNEFSQDNQDWGAFGSYLGGVLGPVVGLVTVLILVVTLLEQQSQMERQHKNELKQDILKLVDKAEAKIDGLLQYEMISWEGNSVILQDMVQGLCPATGSNDPSNSQIVFRLLRLSGEYAESLTLYRDNIDPRFVYGFHRKRVEELYAFLEKNKKLLEQWDRQVNLGMLKQLIDRL